MDIEKKIEQLQSRLDQTKKKVTSNISTETILLGVGAAAPIIIGGSLYLFSPKFVLTEENGKMTRSNTKLAIWTIAPTLLIWAALYGYVYFSKSRKKV